jgi:exopolysaccharide biosynthesis polyprenyl glycosylphosphotransferase
LEVAEFDRLRQIIGLCDLAGIKLTLIPFYTEYIPAKPYVDEVDGLPLINTRRIPLDNTGNAILKRGTDICFSLVLIILTSPLMLLTALLVRLSSPGPVIFRQERVGMGNKPFIMYKFRTMLEGRMKEDWEECEDERKTKIGAWLRKHSLDELPQFFNVLGGTMSLVGPRPELPHFVQEFRGRVPLYMVKHRVRPGITGWAQVNGLRGNTSIRRRIDYDLFYIENWTFTFDIRILALTLLRADKGD